MNAWIVFLIVLVPFLILLAFIASSDSLITIPPGNVGLLLKSGQATDTVAAPGCTGCRGSASGWSPPIRRSSSAPGHADDGQDAPSRMCSTARPALRVTLGDRGEATIGYTVRFRLEIVLRSVHERFGPEGFWNAVRDEQRASLRHRLGESDVGVDDLFGDRRNALEEQIGEAVKAAWTTTG